MAAVVVSYPTSLPGPMDAPFQPAELRQISNLPGPQQLRAMQMDQLSCTCCLRTLDAVLRAMLSVPCLAGPMQMHS